MKRKRKKTVRQRPRLPARAAASELRDGEWAYRLCAPRFEKVDKGLVLLADHITSITQRFESLAARVDDLEHRYRSLVAEIKNLLNIENAHMLAREFENLRMRARQMEVALSDLSQVRDGRMQDYVRMGYLHSCIERLERKIDGAPAARP